MSTGRGTGRGDPILLDGSGATASYFSVFGITPLIGLVYAPDQDRCGGDTRVVVLSEKIWRSVFAADPAVVASAVASFVAVCSHDQQHLACLHWLLGKLAVSCPAGGPPRSRARGSPTR